SSSSAATRTSRCWWPAPPPTGSACAWPPPISPSTPRRPRRARPPPAWPASAPGREFPAVDACSILGRMHEQDFAIVKALVSVAWADGVYADREREMLAALLDAYGADVAEKKAI